MPAIRRLELATEQRAVLIDTVKHHELAYVRERAAALLKIADGEPASVVARHGLLRKRDPDTVYAWMDRYEAEGVPGLVIRAGRGRKPAFSPSAPDSNRSTK